jgi:alkanesulfonate monooxygenase SsuD/methylene tetrahydromethanopterin reductase-like flavin-dependent oxidoreductase (luciferase family)
MQFAIDLPPFGPFSDANVVAHLAVEAEDAGWNGFFLWDHINFKLDGSPEPVAIADPWIHLAAIALRTTSIKLGPMVTPLARRRPWGLAWGVTPMANTTISASQRMPGCMERCSTRGWPF